MDSSATESPLDVLSRAATMVQDNTFNTLPPSYEHSSTGTSTQGSSVLANFTPTRIFQDPLQNTFRGVSYSEQFPIDLFSADSDVYGVFHNEMTYLPPNDITDYSFHYAGDEARMLQRMKPAGINTPKNRRMREYTTGTANKYHHSNKIISSNNRLPHSSEPLDYSTPKRRERGSPPSYLESVQKIQRVPVASGHQPRRSVITSCAPRNVHSTSSTGGVSDPLVDAHFRRSLGEGYVTDDSGSALSVDDHFAKALGEDMWLKLQQMESEEKKRKRTGSNEVTTPTEQVQEISTNELTVTTTTCSTTEIVEQKTIQKSVLRHDRKV